MESSEIRIDNSLSPLTHVDDSMDGQCDGCLLRACRKHKHKYTGLNLTFTLGIFILTIIFSFSSAQDTNILDVKNSVLKDGRQEPVAILWGIADTSAVVGRLFKYHIPSDAFKGDILKYVVTEAGKDSIPQWLHFDHKTNQLIGVPAPSDLGPLYIEVVVTGPKNSQAKDVFSITVSGETPGVLYFSKSSDSQKPPVVRCKREQPETAVTVVLDTDVALLPSLDRVNLLERLTNYLNLLPEMVKLLPVGDKASLDEKSALVSGLGDVKSPRFNGAMVSWLVGCGKVEKDHMPVLQFIESAAKKGGITNAIGHSVIGWHVTSSRFQDKPHRRRRALHATPTPVLTQPPPTQPPDEVISATRVMPTETTTEPLSRTVPSMVSQIQPSQTQMPIEPTKTMVTPEPTAVPEPPMSSAVITPTPTPEPTPRLTTTTTPKITTRPTPKPTPKKTTPEPTTKSTTTTTTTTRAPTTKKPTPEPTPTPHPRCPNDEQKRGPMKMKDINTLVFQTGKLTSHKISNMVFFDCVDGDTYGLNLLLTINKTYGIPGNYFLALKKGKRYWKIEGMPLKKDIGIRNYRITAMNSIGVLPATADFQILVESAGDVEVPLPPPSHEISLTLDSDYDKFTIYNRIEVTQKIAKVFGNDNSDQITVLRVDKGSVVFAWTNNSLPTDSCAVDEIHDNVGKLINEDGSLSSKAANTMKPYRLLGVAAVPMGACEKHPDFPHADAKGKDFHPKSTPEPTYKPVDTKKPTDVDVKIETTMPTDTGKKDAQETSNDEIWITTVVPAVVIVIILLIALLIACILYRKKRKGKMSLEDKHTFVNKGVPVILPDEYGDKGNESTKPLIMEDEKPPLPPPEYTRASSESSRSSGENRHDTFEEHEMDETDINSPLFQRPPPPPAANGTKQPRPHVQPTYKSPDPNVQP